MQLKQTPLSNSEKTEELPDQNGVHATTPLQMVEEHEEDHLTESERQIMLSLTESERLKVKGYVDDGLNFKDATKLVLLENEIEELEEWRNQMRYSESEQREVINTFIQNELASMRQIHSKRISFRSVK